jgi:hypothetical protein
MRKWILMALFAALSVASGNAQPAQQAYPVELALPFGVAAGKLVISGDYLIFVNDTAVESSFVVPRDNVQNVNMDGGVMTIALRQPQRDPSGDRTTINFRFAAPTAADPVVRWSRSAAPARSSPGTAGPNDHKLEGQQFSYEVKHDHRIGSCSGRLIVTADKVSFESLTDINDSRQWSMKDIKEVEHKSPYKLEIKPFAGNDYSFALLGTGMDNADYALLTKLIAAARAAR